MRRLTADERRALIEIDTSDGAPIPHVVFEGLEKLGYGFWGPSPDNEEELVWYVTEKGRRALALDSVEPQ